MSIEFIGKSNFYSLSDMLQVESLIREKLYYLQIFVPIGNSNREYTTLQENLFIAEHNLERHNELFTKNNRWFEKNEKYNF